MKSSIILLYSFSIILISLSALFNTNLPVNQYFVSEFVHGRFGWLVTLSFIFMALGSGFFVVVLFNKLKNNI
jgi:hypothetical protein